MNPLHFVALTLSCFFGVLLWVAFLSEYDPDRLRRAINRLAGLIACVIVFPATIYWVVDGKITNAYVAFLVMLQRFIDHERMRVTRHCKKRLKSFGVDPESLGL
jgi:hypothetical protein